MSFLLESSSVCYTTDKLVKFLPAKPGIGHLTEEWSTFLWTAFLKKKNIYKTTIVWRKCLYFTFEISLSASGRVDMKSFMFQLHWYYNL